MNIDRPTKANGRICQRARCHADATATATVEGWSWRSKQDWTLRVCDEHAVPYQVGSGTDSVGNQVRVAWDRPRYPAVQKGSPVDVNHPCGS
jgi:hypothetical protein